MEDQSKCAMTTSISQNRVRLNETKFSPVNIGLICNASLCAKRTLYNSSGLFRAIVIKRSYCWWCIAITVSEQTRIR